MGLTPAIWGDRERYLETYWYTFPGIWRHGDWVRRDPDGTWYILGRSDDTLNIAGKRICPPEIEAALIEKGAPHLSGERQRWPSAKRLPPAPRARASRFQGARAWAARR